ncbi:MAG: phospholipid/cholesterol/gamma-HCH transport system substrate-binding protein [Candidatus Ordinivivax streblomastigis]|uniref:Phospholipid/cholesterol/gamma-HCH transport system substrate-binding protein n=1 Tax=Candidatus Ordinivivax streblomastigis TaxID=2540710 RepID=A0A5M8NZH1_9BACT|nr:MAG: phospholipid/cholesterol/gamma-HCH transport system substrate-binding protein [Candidatus Ordinivivax streblomastigis]
MKKVFTKEVTIAVITIISLVILFLGLNYMKGINLFQPANYYYISLSNVSELQNSSPVLVDGFKVGIVNDIQYDYDHPGHIVVQIGLDKDLKVQTGSYAELKSNLTAGAYLDLKLNTYVGSYCAIGDTIQGVAAIGMMDKLSTDILPQIEQILPRLDSILLGIQVLVNHPALNQSLNHIEATTADLQKSSAQLSGLLANDIPAIASHLNTVSSDFSVVSGNLKAVDFQRTFSSVDTLLNNMNQISQQLNNPTNSLGLLLNDRTLYDHLDSTAYNASKLFLDLKERPKRYVHFSLF